MLLGRGTDDGSAWGKWALYRLELQHAMTVSRAHSITKSAIICKAREKALRLSSLPSTRISDCGFCAVRARLPPIHREYRPNGAAVRTRQVARLGRQHLQAYA